MTSIAEYSNLFRIGAQMIETNYHPNWVLNLLNTMGKEPALKELIFKWNECSTMEDRYTIEANLIKLVNEANRYGSW